MILRDISGPAGQVEHAWIRPGHWSGRDHQLGDHVEFVGSIEPYWRDDGSQDLGLFRCMEVAHDGPAVVA